MTDSGRRPNFSPMPRDDALDRRQTDACSLKVTGFMQTLEGREYFLRVYHIEPGAVVANIETMFPVRLQQRPHLDARSRLFRSKLPGIIQKVLQDDAQELRISVRRKVIGDD